MQVINQIVLTRCIVLFACSVFLMCFQDFQADETIGAGSTIFKFYFSLCDYEACLLNKHLNNSNDKPISYQQNDNNCFNLSGNSIHILDSTLLFG